MKRRDLLAAPLLTGCSVLPERGYPSRRDWPLVVRRPANTPHATPLRLTLLVRAMTAGPGLEGRGLISLQQDGSVRSDYYEQWVVPPAEAVTESLRQWLAEAGLFRAVLAPGSRAPADIVLEGELTELLTRSDGSARASLAYALLDERSVAVRVLQQDLIVGSTPLTADGPAARATAMQLALAGVFVRLEAALANAQYQSVPRAAHEPKAPDASG